MLALLTTGKHQDQWSPSQELDQPNFSSYVDSTTPDAESLIAAMERVTVLFDRQVAALRAGHVILRGFVFKFDT